MPKEVRADVVRKVYFYVHFSTYNLVEFLYDTGHSRSYRVEHEHLRVWLEQTNGKTPRIRSPLGVRGHVDDAVFLLTFSRTFPFPRGISTRNVHIGVTIVVNVGGRQSQVTELWLRLCGTS